MFIDPIRRNLIGYRETYALVVSFAHFSHMPSTAFARWQSKWAAAYETPGLEYCSLASAN